MTVPLLVREVDRIARERGWSRRQLAHALGIDPTTLSHVRSGRDPISQPLLIQIGVAFGGSPTIQRLMLHYLLIEAPPRHVQRRTGATTDAFAIVPYKVRWRIRRWLAQRDGTGQPQRGLFLTGADPNLLSAAARFVAHELRQDRVAVVVTVRADEHLSPAHATVAVESDLLVIERVEFASASVARLIDARSDALRPMVVTSCRDREALADQHLARTLRAWTETITVVPPPTHRRHAARS